MRPLVSRAALQLLQLLTGMLALIVAPLMASAEPPDINGLGYTQRLGTQLTLDARLVASDGHQQTLREVMNGRPTLLVLGYFACPALCGLIRNDLFSALANTDLNTPRDYSLVFLSIDPAETPQDAADAFRRDMAQNPVEGAAQGWHFMTADAATITQIEQQVGYSSRFDVALKQFLHPAGVVALTPAGQVSSYLLGVTYQAGGVQAAVRQANAGSIGQQAVPILLLCFHYDPTTGKYSFAIMKALRLMGVLTVLTVAGMVLLLRRQGSQQAGRHGTHA